MTATDPIFNQIFRGDFDSELDGIVEAVRLRRKYLASETFAELKVGDKVHFTDKVRPQYMRGHVATVVDKNRTKVVVTLDEAVGKFPAGARITTPTQIVEKVS